MREIDPYRGKMICPALTVIEMQLSLVSQLPEVAL